MDRDRLQRCLEQVGAYRASGPKAKRWAEANEVALLSLQSWCAHAGRWRARLDGVELAPPVRPSRLVAARVVAAIAQPIVAPCVRVELGSGISRIELHWSLAQGRELASWLREFSR